MHEITNDGDSDLHSFTQDTLCGDPFTNGVETGDSLSQWRINGALFPTLAQPFVRIDGFVQDGSTESQLPRELFRMKVKNICKRWEFALQTQTKRRGKSPTTGSGLSIQDIGGGAEASSSIASFPSVSFRYWLILTPAIVKPVEEKKYGPRADLTNKWNALTTTGFIPEGTGAVSSSWDQFKKISLSSGSVSKVQLRLATQSLQRSKILVSKVEKRKKKKRTSRRHSGL